jgi:predicted AlkP superfamily pyrophosphatase or phosphodiesterase
MLFIATDALGSDLLLRSRPRLKSGLAQLMAQGAYFPVARYDFARTATAAGYATLSTGANPWRHGVVANRTVNRFTGKREPVFMDPSHPVLEAAPSSEDVSPQNLMAEALADRLRLATHGRGKAIAVSTEARTAIALAGHLGQAWWFHEPLGKFVTGTYYAKEFPVWVKNFNERKLPDNYFNKPWALSLPAKEYLGDDDRSFEIDWNGLGRIFPHSLTGGLQTPGPQAYASLAVSPYMNDILVQLAKAAMEGEQLGKRDSPDILFVGLSAIGRIYHYFGPNSWEMQDALIKLDHSISELIAAAEKAAGGRSNLSVVLTADHGGAPIPEEATAAGMPSGRLLPLKLHQGLSKELQVRFGVEGLVAGVEAGEVYLNSRAINDRKLDGAAVRRAAAEWLSKAPDIALGVARDDLDDSSEHAGWLRLLRRSYYPERSGDALFLPRPFVVLVEEKEATNHGTPYAYDAEVPVIFSGKGIKPGIYHQTINPADVAPTAAALLEIGEPASVEGTARWEILSSAR